MHHRMTADRGIPGGRARGLAGALAFALLALALPAAPSAATEVRIRCQHELSPKPSLWIFDTSNPEGFFDDGKLRRANVLFAGNQITVRQVEEQPVCHLGKGCTNGKTITEFTTVINRTNNTFLVYCKNIRDDANNWKPGQNCFPKGPNKGHCLKE